MIEQHPERVTRLHENARYFRAAITEAGFTPLAGETPIVPIIVGETSLAIKISELMLGGGGLRDGLRLPGGAAGACEDQVPGVQCAREGGSGLRGGSVHAGGEEGGAAEVRVQGQGSGLEQQVAQLSGVSFQGASAMA